MSLLGYLENLGSTAILRVLVNIMLLLRSIIMSLSLPLIFLITSLFKGFGIVIETLLSPSSLVILTKISRFSTQSVTASLVYL